MRVRMRALLEALHMRDVIRRLLEIVLEYIPSLNGQQDLIVYLTGS
jgi:hypothetical protein